jgi:proteic killer suppression protein
MRPEVRLVCPAGQITQSPVQPHLQKYIPSRFPQIKSLPRAVSSHRGAIAIVTNAGRDAVDAAAPAGTSLGLDCRATVDIRKLLPYVMDMIRSFRDKALERFFATGEGRRLSVQNTRRIANILRALDDASRPEDVNLPGFRFHALVGRDRGRYAVSASGNWRVTFGWIEGDAVDVDLEDYH